MIDSTWPMDCDLYIIPTDMRRTWAWMAVYT